MDQKACNTCGALKPLTAFWRQRGGTFATCRLCAQARNAAWKRDNAERRRDRIIACSNAKRQRDPMATIFAGAKSRAKQRGMEFTITRSDVPMPTLCPVLGIPLASKVGRGDPRCERDSSPSIDRIDSTKGYVPGNVIVVSGRANRIKTNATVDELIAVAVFYEGLRREQGRQGPGGRADAEGQRLQAAVPEMLAPPQEETGSLLSRDEQRDGDQSLLPSLPMGSDIR